LKFSIGTTEQVGYFLNLLWATKIVKGLISLMKGGKKAKKEE